VNEYEPNSVGINNLAYRSVSHRGGIKTDRVSGSYDPTSGSFRIVAFNGDSNSTTPENLNTKGFQVVSAALEYLNSGRRPQSALQAAHRAGSNMRDNPAVGGLICVEVQRPNEYGQRRVEYAHAGNTSILSWKEINPYDTIDRWPFVRHNQDLVKQPAGLRRAIGSYIGDTQPLVVNGLRRPLEVNEFILGSDEILIVGTGNQQISELIDPFSNTCHRVDNILRSLKSRSITVEEATELIVKTIRLTNNVEEDLGIVLVTNIKDGKKTQVPPLQVLDVKVKINSKKEPVRLSRRGLLLGAVALGAGAVGVATGLSRPKFQSPNTQPSVEQVSTEVILSDKELLSDFESMRLQLQEIKNKFGILPKSFDFFFPLFKVFSNFDLTAEDRVLLDVLKREWGGRISFLEQDSEDKLTNLKYVEKEFKLLSKDEQARLPIEPEQIIRLKQTLNKVRHASPAFILSFPDKLTIRPGSGGSVYHPNIEIELGTDQGEDAQLVAAIHELQHLIDVNWTEAIDYISKKDFSDYHATSLEEASSS
jgi:hypothetical protein